MNKEEKRTHQRIWVKGHYKKTKGRTKVWVNGYWKKKQLENNKNKARFNLIMHKLNNLIKLSKKIEKGHRDLEEQMNELRSKL